MLTDAKTTTVKHTKSYYVIMIFKWWNQEIILNIEYVSKQKDSWMVTGKIQDIPSIPQVREFVDDEAFGNDFDDHFGDVDREIGVLHLIQYFLQVFIFKDDPGRPHLHITGKSERDTVHENDGNDEEVKELIGHDPCCQLPYGIQWTKYEQGSWGGETENVVFGVLLGDYTKCVFKHEGIDFLHGSAI